MNSETYKYKSTQVAKLILSKANESKIVMNMTKLQKLLYVAYGVYMVVKSGRLTDETPQAWPYGPVFPTSRNNLLNTNIHNYDISKDDDCKDIATDTDMHDLVDVVLKAFGGWSAGQLTEWSHGVGTPWERTRCLSGFKWGYTIQDEYIQEYFSKILKPNGGN